MSPGTSSHEPTAMPALPSRSASSADERSSQVVDAVDQRTRQREQCLAGLRRYQAPAAALQQDHAVFQRERLQLEGDCRLADPEHFRGTRHRAQARHLGEGAQ